MRHFLLVIVLVAVPVWARAQVRPQAQAKLDSGLKHFDAKEWQQAIDDFKAGYAIDPQPVFLFAWAQAERLSGDCPSAVKLYEKFLATKPNEAKAEAARQNLARCQEALGPHEPDTKVEKVEKVEKKPPPPKPKAEERYSVSPWYRDPVGGLFVGSGAIGLGVGAAFFAMSLSSEQAAEDAAQADPRVYNDYAEAIARAQSQRTVALIGLAAGGTLVGIGIVRYATRGNRRERVSVWFDGQGVVVAGRW